MARALYCSVDPALYYPEERRFEWQLGYMGTYSADRQPVLDGGAIFLLLIEAVFSITERAVTPRALRIDSWRYP